MAKEKQTQATEPVDDTPRRHRRLRQRETELQRRIILIVGITLGAVVALLLGGVILEEVVKPRQPIAAVNGETISTAAFLRRLRFEQEGLLNQIGQYAQLGQQFASEGGENPFQSSIEQFANQLSNPESLSLQTLDNMIEDTLIAQLAVNQSVSVTDEEVQMEVEKQFGYERNPTPTPTPDPVATPMTDTVPAPTPISAQDFQNRYSERLKEWQASDSFTEADFRAWVRARLLRDKLLETAAAGRKNHGRADPCSSHPDPRSPRRQRRTHANCQRRAHAYYDRGSDADDHRGAHSYRRC